MITTWRRYTTPRGVSPYGTDRRSGVFKAMVVDRRKLPPVGAVVTFRPPLRRKSNRIDKIMQGEIKQVDPNGLIWVYRYSETPASEDTEGGQELTPVFVNDIAEYRTEDGDLVFPSSVVPSHDQIAAFMRHDGLSEWV